MHPVFYLGPLEFPAYFSFLTLGYFLAVMLAWRKALNMPQVDPVKFIDLSIFLFLAGIAGARLMHVLVDGYLDEYINLCLNPLLTKPLGLLPGGTCQTDAQCVSASLGALCHPDTGLCHQGQDCLRVFKFWYGGLAFMGGLITAAVFGVWLISRWKNRLHLASVADLAGIGIPLGLVFGRLGCWFAGCCFGCLAGDSYGVVFPAESAAFERHVELGILDASASASLPVVPVQLYQTLANLMVFLLCYALFMFYKKRDGRVLGLFLVLSSLGRFILEYWRDDHRGLWFSDALSSSQILGIPLSLVGLYIILRPWIKRVFHA